MPITFCREQCIQKIDDYVREHKHLSIAELESDLFKYVAVKRENGMVYSVWDDAIKAYIADLKKLIEYTKKPQ